VLFLIKTGIADIDFLSGNFVFKSHVYKTSQTRPFLSISKQKNTLYKYGDLIGELKQ